MRKLEALKVGGVQREENRKRTFLWVGKLNFLLAIFSLLLFISTSKMTSKALGSIPITFYITQNEAQMMKI